MFSTGISGSFGSDWSGWSSYIPASNLSNEKSHDVPIKEIDFPSSVRCGEGPRGEHPSGETSAESMNLADREIAYAGLSATSTILDVAERNFSGAVIDGIDTGVHLYNAHGHYERAEYLSYYENGIGSGAVVRFEPHYIEVSPMQDTAENGCNDRDFGGADRW